MADKIVLAGVGTVYLLSPDGKTNIALGRLQDMTLDLNTTVDDVMGGDSLMPFYQFPKEMKPTATFTSAEFSLDLLAAAQGTTVNSTGGKLIKTEKVTVATGGTATLSITSGIDVKNVFAVDDTGKPLTLTSGTPDTGQFECTSNGTLTFDSSLVGKTVMVTYAYTPASGVPNTTLLNTSIPNFVKILHTSAPFLMPDNTKRVIHTIIRKARCDGKLTIDQKRGTAYAPKLTFTVLDPQDPDGGVIDFAQETIS